MSWENSLTKAAGRFRSRTADEIDAAALALVADAQAASTLRSYQRDPNVAALGIERSRDRLDRWGWLFIVLGLLFTTVNVALFILGPEPVGGYPVYVVAVAVVVEPMVAGLLLVLLRGEQIAGRYGFRTGRWARNTRWTTLAFTYVMNTSQYWVALDVRGIFIHSVPVVLVFLAAEALTQQREVLTRVVAHVATIEPDVKSQPAGLHSVREIASEVQVDGDAPESERDGSGSPERAQEPSGTPRVGRPKGSNRLALEKAYRGLRAAGEVDVRPADLDRAANVPPGTAKKVLAQIVREYEEEVETGAQSITVAG